MIVHRPENVKAKGRKVKLLIKEQLPKGGKKFSWGNPDRN
jgi:hypothetical protein